MRAAAAAGAGRRMASMEREPKALSLNELKYAREAALYVLSTHSSEDAVRIFTEGLKPVLGVRQTSNSIDHREEEDDDDVFDPDEFLDDDREDARRRRHRRRRYGLRAAEERDVATAPF